MPRRSPFASLFLALVFASTGSGALAADTPGPHVAFDETDARPMGRTARGVRGISLAKGDAVVGMEVLATDASILTVTERGYGKRSPCAEYRVQSRGGSGIIGAA